MIIPVILAGGAGTRLWPVSREAHPKPFMPLHNGESLLQKTLQRAIAIPFIEQLLTVTNYEYYFKTKDEYSSANVTLPKHYFLLEPTGRNTAPAIGMAAFFALQQFGLESTLLILPADHLISDQELFNKAVQDAYTLAKNNKLVTFGIKPTAPETGFGYIKLANPIKEVNNTFLIEKFVEKPSSDLAQQYLASNQYLWNSGMFCFKAEQILAELQTHSASLYQQIEACFTKSKHFFMNDALEIDKETFCKTSDISLDYAVMEKTNKGVVIAGDFSWSDIGSWLAVGDLLIKDAGGNRLQGETILLDVSNSFISSENRLVAAIGVDNLIVIDTPDALLIADQKRSQDVKKIVSQLKETNHQCYKNHRTVFRPWGSFTVLEENEYVKIKRIVVKPNAALSLQMHQHRSEHWIVVNGQATVTNGENVFVLKMNESTFIPAQHKHRLENNTKEDLVIIEVQTGTYLGEDDIVRFGDQYGRV